ncbi:hypothetical protein OESDEN_17025 [Oesophagostomum dentatum]|uniref:SCP domain-containing protein n=1 Tax=Oesophagostomum dentatum TaxID=61180 RepID=A0A0B1SEC0_OESDE|nr:hypothetical protein OESDEN_17025 [Oesophagostomum dentatum]
MKKNGVGPEPRLIKEVWERNVGHYTQMAWDTSYKLGCAISRCKTFSLVVCQYFKKGNYWGSLAYDIGEPCKKDADCPGKYTCSVSEGLCIVMAWENSYRLGCAINTCKTFTLVLCQYGKHGNIRGALAYDIGEPCKKDADCPGKYTCSASEGLCIVVK